MILEVRERVKVSLNSLPESALQLLRRCAVFQLPVPEGFWLGMLGDEAAGAALDLLRGRALVVEETGLRLHNLVRQVAYGLLRGEPSEWQAAHGQAAQLWLTDYEPAPGAERLEQVRGYLEAFHHYCELPDWEKAKEILLTPLGTPTKDKVYWQLGIWGYPREQAEICHRILGKLDQETDGIWLNTLGGAYYALGNYQQAIDYHLQSLAITRAIRDRRGEGNALGSLGGAYYSLGNYQQAIDYLQQALAIARAIGDRFGEGAALGNLGDIQIKIGQYKEAQTNLQQALVIFRDIQSVNPEAEVLKMFAELYYTTHQPDLARDYCQQALALATELGIPLVQECEALQFKIENEKLKMENQGEGLANA